MAIAFGTRWEAVRPTVTGVNHFPVITALDIDGADGLALLRDLVDEVGGLAGADVRGGSTSRPSRSRSSTSPAATCSASRCSTVGARCPAAGDRHLAEFLPSVLTERSGWGAAWGIELTPIARRASSTRPSTSPTSTPCSPATKPLATHQSGELVAPVIDSLLTGTRREVPLNLPNTGQCPDLPDGAVVESICVVDGDGMRGRDQARVPAPLAEILRRQVATQELTVEAAVTGDRRAVLAAFALDPLAGRGDLRDTEAMVEELLAGTARWLPQFDCGDSVRPLILAADHRARGVDDHRVRTPTTSPRSRPRSRTPTASSPPRSRSPTWPRSVRSPHHKTYLSINRTGLAGSAFELDDRLVASVARAAADGWTGIKHMVRIDLADPHTAPALELLGRVLEEPAAPGSRR